MVLKQTQSACSLLQRGLNRSQGRARYEHCCHERRRRQRNQARMWGARVTLARCVQPEAASSLEGRTPQQQPKRRSCNIAQAGGACGAGVSIKARALAR